MKRSIHRTPATLLSLIAIALTSVAMQCPCKTISVEIPDLEANEIQGIQCWRGEEQDSGVFDQSIRILLGETSSQDGVETMEYTMVDAQGEPIPVSSSAVVIRGESEDDPVSLHFIFSSWMELPGWVRISTFNEVGESDLSEEAIYL